MSRTLRASLLILAIALGAVVTFYQPGRGAPETPPVGGAASPATPGMPDNNPAANDAFTLPSDRQVQKRLEAAQDYLKTRDWGEAVRLLQAALDVREDVLLPVRRPGQPATHWVSARAETLRLFAALPPKALEFYELHHGAAARARLEMARKTDDPQLLDEVTRRYPYTKAGAEAMALLGAYHLDRGRFETAAFFFDHLLQRQTTAKVEPLHLFHASLAFRLAGDRERAEQTWKQLAERAGRTGLRFGTQTVGLEQLRQEIERLAERRVQSSGWFLFRGDARRTAQAAGGVPFLEPRWQHATAAHPETRRLLEAALKNQAESLQPSLPGAFPIAVGGKLIYRSHGGIHAVDLQTGKEVWRRDLALSLDACMADPGKRVSVRSWLQMYSPFAGGNLGGMGVLGGGMGGLGALGLGGGNLGAFPGAGGNLGALGLGGMNPGLGGAVPITSGGGIASGLTVAPPLVLENSALGTLSSDGRRVYAVVDMAVPPPPILLQELQPGIRRPLGPLSPYIGFNRLLALDVETGEAAWERGGDGKGDLHGCYFLGPPLPVTGKLYALAEKQGEILLVCLESGRGDISWSQPLVFIRDKLLGDVGRRLQAAHLAYADGLLVCPTNAGAVVAVDLRNRSLAWAHGYRQQPGAPSALSFVTGPVWKGSAPIVQDGKVIFTAADDDAVTCVNLRDGALLWRLPRTEDDLYLAGVYQGKVLLVGRNACRAVSLADGTKQLWTISTGLPSGQGVASGNLYYLPLHRGAICALDLDKGTIAATVEAPNGGAPGNLLFHGGDVLTQSAIAVAAYPQLQHRLNEIEARLSRNPGDTGALTERGELKLYQGDLAGAIVDLRRGLAGAPERGIVQRTRTKLHEALTQLLQRDFRAGERFLDEYRDLCRLSVPEEATALERLRIQVEQQRRQTSYLCLVARGREGQPGAPLEALHIYEELNAREHLGQPLPIPEDPVVRDRLDVWARNRVAALFKRADAAGARLLHEYVAQTWQRLRAGDDDAALERFAWLFAPACPEGREARLLLAERWLEDHDRGRCLEAELLLLQLQRERSEPRLAARATETLARLLLQKGLVADALFQYRILARDFGNLEVRDGKNGSAFLDDLVVDKRFLPYFSTAPRWEEGRIRARDPRAAQQAALPGSQPLPVITFAPKGDLQPLFRSHILVLDLLASQFKLLDRETGAEVWSQRVALDSFRGYLVQFGFAGSLVPCEVQGHLAVVNLGAVVFGLDLLDHRILWKKSFVDGPFLADRMVVVNNTDNDATVEHLLQLFAVDRLGSGQQRLLGQLGPLGPSHVTLRTTGGLVALDPVRGDVLWTRSDVAVEAEVFGDDAQVYVVDARAGVASRALSTTDGTVVAGVPDFAKVYSHDARHLGRRFLVLDNNFPVRLRLYDIPTGKEVWQEEVPVNGLPLRSEDPHLAGTIAPDGRFRITDLRRCKEVCRGRLDDPHHLDNVQNIYVVQDRSRFYLVCQGSDVGAGGNESWPCLSGLRGLPVHGMVYAFDRATGKRLWFDRVRNQVLLLEQFEELPILLFANGSSQAMAGNVTQSVSVQSIDKNTGKRLLVHTDGNNGGSFHAVRVDGYARTIDLVGPTTRLRHYQAGK